jgi:hypothetical protein
MAKILKENKIIYYLSSYLRTVLPSKNFKEHKVLLLKLPLLLGQVLMLPSDLEML